MKNKLETIIEHPSISGQMIVRTEYEWTWETKTLSYQSFIEGVDYRVSEFKDFLIFHSNTVESLNFGMLPVLAQHHKIECYLWATNYEPVALYGLRNSINYYPSGGGVIPV